ncbi:MAG: NADH-quinone oxidoreductase subunit N [Bacteroidota bacterium]
MKATTHQQLLDIQQSVGLVTAEWLLLVGIILLLGVSLVRKSAGKLSYLVAAGVVVASAAATLFTWPHEPQNLFNGAFTQSSFASYFKMLASAGTLLTLFIDHTRKRGAEYYLLVLSVLLGTHLLLMSSNFIVLLLSLELISLPSYVLATGLAPGKRNAEAAWKYFLYGSASTAIMIFGISYLFGLTGSLDFTTTAFAEGLVNQASPLFWIGGLLTLAGFLFKIAAAPFHFWAPDVYEASPTPLVAFFSVVPKLAGVGTLARFVVSLQLFGQSPVDWSLIVGCIALLSLVVGNLGALAQTNIKRMMAYSSIAQAGMLLAVVATHSPEGYRMTLFYASILVLMNFLAFLGIRQVEDAFVTTDFKALAGKGVSLLFPSVCLTLGLVSLVGLPPTAGFMAKLFVFTALWQKFRETEQIFYAFLFGVGLLTTVTSLFFYLKLPYALFIQKAAAGNVPKQSSLAANLLALILVIMLLYLFFHPGLLMGWVNKVNFVL